MSDIVKDRLSQSVTKQNILPLSNCRQCQSYVTKSWKWQYPQNRVGLQRESAVLLTHTHTTVYRPFVQDSPGRPVPEETFTHSHPSWWSDILYHLPPFTIIHGNLLVQFTSLTVLSDNLSPGPLWSSSWPWTLAAHAHTNAACFAAIPMLCHLYLVSLSQLLTWKSVF